VLADESRDFQPCRDYGGTPCLTGTRVPFQTLLDYLEGGNSLDEFLEDFPGVSRDLAVAALQQTGRRYESA
jgi:uncharacterized protein (DUF433 family)